MSSPARAQQGQQGLRKIGFVSWFAPSIAVHAEQFRKGLRDLGYVEGRDVAVEAHFTAGDLERTREVLRKLVQGKVDILVVEATPAIAVAKQEAGSLPIVMTLVSDPIAAGFAQSLSRPGGNLTGRTMLGPNLAGKRIDLIKEMRPQLRTVAFLGSAKDVNTARFVEGTRAETDRAGMKLIVRLVESPESIDTALFDVTGHHHAIVPMASDAGLPVVSDWIMFAEAGAVFTLGVDTYANMRRAAYFVDRIFKGTPPAELPIEQPTEVRLTVNAIAARRFGWQLPPSLLARADEVIE
jgi:putative tryptophan/tyrosine transport system substrate-binding protein